MHRLFDPDASAPCSHTAYVAMPMSGSTDGERRTNLKANARFCCQVKAALDDVCFGSEPAWRLDVVTGADHSTPYSTNWDPNETREWVRWQFLNRVDVLIAVMLRESTGCGRELGLALALGIPTLLLHEEHLDPGVYAGASKFEGILCVQPFNKTGLRQAVADFARSHADTIRAQPCRRDDWSKAADPLRQRLLRAWRDLSEAQRTTAASVVHLHRAQLVEILNDPGEFAARLGPIIELMYVLGVARRPEGMSVPLVSFAPAELDGLAQAIDTYELQPRDIFTAVEQASELIARGGDRRLGLGTARGWKRLLDERHVRGSGQA